MDLDDGDELLEETPFCRQLDMLVGSRISSQLVSHTDLSPRTENHFQINVRQNVRIVEILSIGGLGKVYLKCTTFAKTANLWDDPDKSKRFSLDQIVLGPKTECRSTGTVTSRSVWWPAKCDFLALSNHAHHAVRSIQVTAAVVQVVTESTPPFSRFQFRLSRLHDCYLDLQSESLPLVYLQVVANTAMVLKRQIKATMLVALAGRGRRIYS